MGAGGPVGAPGARVPEPWQRRPAPVGAGPSGRANPLSGGAPSWPPARPRRLRVTIQLPLGASFRRGQRVWAYPGACPLALVTDDANGTRDLQQGAGARRPGTGRPPAPLGGRQRARGSATPARCPPPRHEAGRKESRKKAESQGRTHPASLQPGLEPAPGAAPLPRRGGGEGRFAPPEALHGAALAPPPHTHTQRLQPRPGVFGLRRWSL